MPGTDFLDLMEKRCVPFLREVVAEMRRIGVEAKTADTYAEVADFLAGALPTCRGNSPVAELALKAVVETAGDLKLNLSEDLAALPAKYRVRFDELCGEMPRTLAKFIRVVAAGGGK